MFIKVFLSKKERVVFPINTKKVSPSLLLQDEIAQVNSATTSSPLRPACDLNLKLLTERSSLTTEARGEFSRAAISAFRLSQFSLRPSEESLLKKLIFLFWACDGSCTCPDCELSVVGVNNSLFLSLEFEGLRCLTSSTSFRSACPKWNARNVCLSVASWHLGFDDLSIVYWHNILIVIS